MAFLAKHSDLATDQQSVVDRAVGRVTTDTLVLEETALSELDVLKDERPLLIRVAAQADGVLSPGDLYRLRPVERAMLLMAVATIHAPFRHLVMKGPGKLRADFPMTIKAQRRRFLSENVFVRHLLMRIVTIVAGNDIDIMLVLVKVAPADAFLLVAFGTHGHDFQR